MRNALICTVGTSLLEINLKRLSELPDTFPNLPALTLAADRLNQKYR